MDSVKTLVGHKGSKEAAELAVVELQKGWPKHEYSISPNGQGMGHSIYLADQPESMPDLERMRHTISQV